MAQFCGLKEIALGQQLQPVGDKVMNGALPFAVGVTAFQAAMRLLGGLSLREGIVDLYERFRAGIHVLLVGVFTIDIEKLERIGQSCTHE